MPPIIVMTLATMIKGVIVHILNITPKEEKRIESLKRLILVSSKETCIDSLIVMVILLYILKALLCRE